MAKPTFIGKLPVLAKYDLLDALPKRWTMVVDHGLNAYVLVGPRGSKDRRSWIYVEGMTHTERLDRIDERLKWKISNILDEHYPRSL